jgi:hypothetical protein
MSEGLFPVGIMRPTKSSGDGTGGGASSVGAGDGVVGDGAAHAQVVAGGTIAFPQRSQFTDAL